MPRGGREWSSTIRNSRARADPSRFGYGTHGPTTMLSERDIEQAHPEAFDFAFGNLPSAKRAEFNRHLASCRYCQGVINEYREIGGIIQQLPPHVEPPPDLEDRTVAAMVAALAEQRAKPARQADAESAEENQAATRVYPIPEVHHAAEPDTRVQPRPQFQPPAEDEPRVHSSLASPPAPAEPQARPMVTRLPVWRRHRGRLAAVVAAAAAAIIGAIAIPLSLLGSGPGPPRSSRFLPPRRPR